MKFVQEKKKLESLSETTTAVDRFNDENNVLLSDVYRNYSAIITELCKKEPNVFGNFRNYSVPEIKAHKRSIDKIDSIEIKKENFNLFRESLDQSIGSTIEYITDFVQ